VNSERIRKTGAKIEYVYEGEKDFLHVETRNMLRPREMCLLQGSEPDVFQISNVGG
jgi:hypothetical protein